MNFTPKDQIILLAALESESRRRGIWALKALAPRFERLADAGLLERDSKGAAIGLTDPAGQRAVELLKHITLDDLLAEHFPEAPKSLSGPAPGANQQSRRPA